MTIKLKSKTQSRATTIDQLPIAQSRVEEFLSYLSGKSTVLADLPKPQSRVEEFLEYLCHHRGTGGGGINLPIDAVNVNFNDVTSQLGVTTVQAAIDEINRLVNNKANKSFLVATELGLVGDGTTDNSATFQTLVQRTDVQGKTIFFPKGTYIFGQVGLRDNLHLIGEPGTVFKLKDGSTHILAVTRFSNVKFENIDFWGGGTADRPSTEGDKIGVKLSGTKRVSFENCWFRGFDKTGLFVESQGADTAAGNHYSYNLMINACRFEQSYYGMMFNVRAEYANVVGSIFGQNYWGAFVGGGNNQFSNCQFNSNQNGLREVGGTTDGVTYPNNSHNSFTGCQFNHNSSHSVKLDNVEVGIMFTGCQFFDGIMEFTGSTKGVIFTGCEGGTWRHYSRQTGQVMYTDCYFFTQPMIENNNGNTIYLNNMPDDLLDLSSFVTESKNNNFIGTNHFNGSRPTVTEYTNLTGANTTGTTIANGSSYWINYDTYIEANTHIESIAIPIYNAEVGYKTRVSVFAANTDNKTFLEIVCDNQEFAVTSKQFNGQNCIIVPINKSYNQRVSFGFKVAQVSGRGLMYDTSGTVNSCWGGNTLPNANGLLTPTFRYKFAYTTVSVTTSSVALVPDTEVIWEKLDFVEYRDTGNLFNKDKLVRGKYVASNGTIGDNPDWCIYWSDITINQGDTFRLSRNDNVNLWFVNIYGHRIAKGTLDSNNIFTVPNNPDLVGFVFNVRNNGQIENELMLYRGTQLPSTYQPYTGDYCVTFPHLEFKFGFNNEGRTVLGDDLQTAVSVLATMVTGQNPIGELKTLSQNEGESTTINGRKWLRCDGQTVSSADYSELYQKIGSQFTKTGSDEVENTTKSGEDDAVIINPDDVGDSLEDVDIVVDFNLPTNLLPIGYLYICAK